MSKNMICPSCQCKETKVIDSRTVDEGTVIRRRRECEKCGFRFSTYEQLEILNLEVVKKNGSRENYDREKLESGIKKACLKRSISHRMIRNIVADVENEIIKRSQTKKSEEDTIEISSSQIGEIVMEKLMVIDEVAYIRFASVYRSFGDLQAFNKEINQLKK